MAESAAYNTPDMSLSTNHYLKSKLAEYQAATGSSQNVYTQQNVTIQQKALWWDGEKWLKTFILLIQIINKYKYKLDLW